MIRPPGPALVMGAGAIGCWVGGRLQAAGAEVHFVGRPSVLGELRVAQAAGLSAPRNEWMCERLSRPQPEGAAKTMTGREMRQALGL